MLKVFEFVPAPLNMSNDITASAIWNTRTYQPTNAGGLVLGDMFDVDNQAAANLANPTIGMLFQGRYRRVHVATNATAANVARGHVAYVAPGFGVEQAVTVTPGSGQTPGVYQLIATGGGGTGAIIQVVVGPTGTVTGIPVIIATGTGYTSTPTFTLAAGGTPATFAAQMVQDTYTVTTADVAGVNTSQPRGVFLNTVTPGNYGWLQEDGIATVLQAATVTSATVGAVVTPVAGGTGVVQATVATAAALPSSIGTAIDVPVANNYYRVLLNIPVWNG